MVIDNYTDLLMFATPEYGVPLTFFHKELEESDTCIFLVSCANHERMIYIDDSFERLTGYPSANFIKGGLHFLFPLIHPDDLPEVTGKFMQAQEKMFKPDFNKLEIFPVVADYRFKKNDGEWIVIRDSKYFIFPNNNAELDNVLCKMELAPVDASLDKTCNRMIEVSSLVLNGQDKKIKSNEAELIASRLTNREKEILFLISDGFSTKMIAEKCNISINTVETHRRHLLEKLQVKNSMELVKEASRIFRL